MADLGFGVIIVLALGAAVVLLVVARFGSMPGVTRPIRRTFFCPWKERDATVEFQEEVWDGRLVEVSECSVFAPPTAVSCEKRCLFMGRFPETRGEDKAA